MVEAAQSCLDLAVRSVENTSASSDCGCLKLTGNDASVEADVSLLGDYTLLNVNAAAAAQAAVLLPSTNNFMIINFFYKNPEDNKFPMGGADIANLIDLDTGSIQAFNSSHVNQTLTCGGGAADSEGNLWYFGTHSSYPAGGYGGNLNTAFVYNRSAGTWRQTGNLSVRRWYPSVTLFPDKQIWAAMGSALLYYIDMPSLHP